LASMISLAVQHAAAIFLSLAALVSTDG